MHKAFQGRTSGEPAMHRLPIARTATAGRVHTCPETAVPWEENSARPKAVGYNRRQNDVPPEHRGFLFTGYRFGGVRIRACSVSESWLNFQLRSRYRYRWIGNVQPRQQSTHRNGILTIALKQPDSLPGHFSGPVIHHRDEKRNGKEGTDLIGNI